MARKNQKLINYHSPNVLSTHNEAGIASGLSYGEITIIHAPEQPLIGTKTGDNTVAWFMSSGQVETSIHNAITGATGDISKLQTDVQDLKDFSGYVETNYATKTYADDTAKAASATAYTSAVTYIDNTLKDYAYSSITHNEIVAEKTRAEGIEGALRSDVNTLSGYMETITEESGLSATVIANKTKLDTLEATYETKQDAQDKYDNATSYTKTVSGNIETYIHETYWTSAETQDQLTGITQNISDLSGSVIATSGAVKTLSGDVVGYVDTKLSTVYTYKNSVQSKSDLPTTGNKTGDVYNVIDGDGTPGEAGYTPPGTNYAWNGSGWDALGGTIDLSAYATKSDVSGITNSLHNEVVELQTATGNLNTNINYVSGQVDTLSGKVVNDYYTKTATDETFLKIAEADKKYYTSGQVETTYLKKEDAQNTYLTITSANSTFDTITTSISNLSGTTQEIETKVNNSISAVTTAEVTTPDNTTNTEYASGVKIDTDNAGRVTKFDFSELVIDCGEYGNE